MRKTQRIGCLFLALLVLGQLLVGCSANKTDDELYLTKGEFFAYFVHENNMTSNLYSSEEIASCKDGSVEAAVIAEWGYLLEKQAKRGLKKPVNKEIVVTVCANATFDLMEGDVSDIKDADMLKTPQLIADAYASGFFELENGYFDGAAKMTLAACEEILYKAKEYTANVHYEIDDSIVMAEGVIVDEGDDYADGDIVVEFYEETTENQDNTVQGTEIGNTGKTPATVLLGSVKKAAVINSVVDEDIKAIPLSRDLDFYGFNQVRGFSADIAKVRFETILGNPEVGDTVVLARYEMFGNNVQYGQDKIIGVLKDFKLIGERYYCLFEYPTFEEAAEKVEKPEDGAAGIDVGSFIKEKTEYMGWTLEFDISDSSVKISAKKKFTVYETGRAQDWQNAKQTVTATTLFTMEDFRVDVNNLKSFATKKNKGYIKITCDTDMDFSLSQSLRYTPDSNRNGKFPSNWSTSRWTDPDSKGAEEIKVARFRPSLSGVVGADIYIYLKISVDGKLSFRTSIEDGGIQIITNNGAVSCNKLGKRQDEIKANLNVHGRFGIDASVKLFTFINVIEYDIGFDVDGQGLVDLYYDEDLNTLGVYADEEGLTEYAAEDSKFTYCIGVMIDVGASGKLLDSGVKMILDVMDKGSPLDFEVDIWSGCFHFEDGSFVEKCTRGKEDEEKIEKTDDEIELGSYKVAMPNFTCTTVDLKALPSETVKLLKSKNSITAKSKDEDIVIANYNKNTKTIILEASGEGSTEVIITAKKGVLWWKEIVEQEISVTVNTTETGTIDGLVFPFVYSVYTQAPCLV